MFLLILILFRIISSLPSFSVLYLSYVLPRVCKSVYEDPWSYNVPRFAPNVYPFGSFKSLSPTYICSLPRSVVVRALCYKPEGRGFMT
jgi:hypothetical protein